MHATVKEGIVLKKSNYEMEKVTEEYNGSFIEYLEKESIIESNADETYKINVTNLIGEKQALGNGTGLKDVYKLEKIAETERYVVNYYNEKEAKTEITEINVGKIENNNKKPEQMEPTTIYAKEYSDGTTIFSSDDYVDSSHGEVVDTFLESELNKKYDGEPPRWLELRGTAFVQETHFDNVIIHNKIAPTSTSYWFDSSSSVRGLENLITNNVTNMELMFAECSFEELDLSNFDTSSVASMRYMFSSRVLRKLNVSSFDTSKVTNMEGMFHGCELLEILDLSSFDTSKVTNMWGMFKGCRLLEVLDLSSFDTSEVTDMRYMFEGCGLLEVLDLSSFEISETIKLGDIFYGCNNLKTVYVKNEEIGELLKAYAPSETTSFVVK